MTSSLDLEGRAAVSDTGLPKGLVLTLFSGEAEYDACKTSVAIQEGVLVEHVCFEWLGNREAHEALYATIMKRAGEFDFFVKLDADMVLTGPRSLRTIYDMFIRQADLDHLSIPVFDVPSGTYLMGVHMFSPRAHWEFPLNPMYPDRHPVIPGNRRIDPNFRTRLVDHMPNPSEKQMLALGIHRATKIVQSGSGEATRPAYFPLSYLKRVAVNRAFDPVLRRLAMRGMFKVILSGSTAVTSKAGLPDLPDDGFFVRLLASGFEKPVFGRIIFTALRLRYVHWRKVQAALRNRASGTGRMGQGSRQR